MRKTVPAKITIANRGGDGPIEVTVNDSNSGLVALEVSIPREDFLDALFGLARVGCEMTHYEKHRYWGMKKELKGVGIDLPVNVSMGKGEKEIFLKVQCEPLEVDGWKADITGSLHTQQNTYGKHHLYLCRYVDPETGEPVE